VGAALLDHFSNDLEESKQAFVDYCGIFHRAAEYAEQFTEETTTVPNNLSFYINYELMARDMELNGHIFTIVTGINEVHVFWSL